MRVVGYVVKALRPGERAQEARCYALGNIGSPWTSLRARAFVFRHGITAAGTRFCDDPRAWAFGHRDQLRAHGCAPPGTKLVVARLVRRKKGEVRS